MRLAQQACRVSPYPDLEKGLYLFEHRRCYDEIISFSNALCYKGKLRPLRGSAPADAGLPALGYIHVEGRALSSGSSRCNPLEAQTIAAWLDANRAGLEARYGRSLEKIVAIVTPFGRQVREIRDACVGRRIAVEGCEAMTIGTVHALQGAERPVVIFSPVYSKHADGGFIDVSPSMLNVMVSRAGQLPCVWRYGCYGRRENRITKGYPRRLPVRLKAKCA
jgi:superfamily I DNA and/or RNA helicase